MCWRGSECFYFWEGGGLAKDLSRRLLVLLGWGGGGGGGGFEGYIEVGRGILNFIHSPLLHMFKWNCPNADLYMKLFSVLNKSVTWSSPYPTHQGWGVISNGTVPRRGVIRGVKKIILHPAWKIKAWMWKIFPLCSRNITLIIDWYVLINLYWNDIVLVHKYSWHFYHHSHGGIIIFVHDKNKISAYL